MRLYLDANVIIYLIEGTDSLREAVLSWIDQAEAEPDGVLITSYLSTVECRTTPMRDEQLGRLALFDGFFARDRLLVPEVTRAVLDRTTALRARFGFKTADAIHLATALLHEADVLLTADTGFARFPDMRIVTLDPSAV